MKSPFPKISSPFKKSSKNNNNVANVTEDVVQRREKVDVKKQVPEEDDVQQGRVKEENMNNEDILQINNYFTSKYDNDLISCYKVIDDYITKIKELTNLEQNIWMFLQSCMEH